VAMVATPYAAGKCPVHWTYEISDYGLIADISLNYHLIIN